MTEAAKKRKTDDDSTEIEDDAAGVVATTTSAPAAAVVKQRAITHIIAIDIEATGPNTYANFMPEMAASFWRIGDTEPLDTFYAYIAQPQGTEWDEKCRVEFWTNPAKGQNGVTPLSAMNKRQLTAEVKSPERAMRQFVSWAQRSKEMLGREDTVIVITDTNEFDTAFLNVYLGRHCAELCPNLNVLFGEYRSTRDIDAFYYGMGWQLKKWGAEETALGALNEKALPDWVLAYKATHNPLDDANAIGATASYLLSRCD